jgi:uncharacterized membrane protein
LRGTGGYASHGSGRRAGVSGPGAPVRIGGCGKPCQERTPAMELGERPVNLRVHVPWLAEALEWVAGAIEGFAILILVFGMLRFVFYFLRNEMRWKAGVEGTTDMAAARIILAHYILSALEVFIVADLIMLVLTMSMGNLLFLALLVIVRTGVSYFLEHEIRALEARDQT